jgi:hypothetical protein
MFLGSLKLAVLVILTTATLAAIGTFVEASYNSEVAQKWVYYSIYMRVTLIFLSINLIISAAHRWPWKKKHTGFVTAHAGILLLLLGSLITSRMGVDGSMFFEMGSTVRKVNISEYQLVLYVGEDFQYFPMYDKSVDFIVDHPKSNPVEFKYQNDLFKITDYIPFAIQKTEVVPSDTIEASPALRFQIYNDRVNVTEWLQQPGPGRPGIMALGPANIVLDTAVVGGKRTPYKPTGGNEIVVQPASLDKVAYTVFYRDQTKKPKKGTLKVGDLVETGWMGLQFRVLNFYPRAIVKNQYTALERPTPLTSQAIEVEFNGEKRWLGLNGILKFFTDNRSYILKFGNKQLDLGFDMTLKDFEVGRYQGTMRAATYKSSVDVQGLGVHEISMNEPLKHAGYTFYQASFQEDPQTGRPTASILSVNYDPGRFLKYFGAFLIVLGAILMFYLGGYFNKKATT